MTDSAELLYFAIRVAFSLILLAFLAYAVLVVQRELDKSAEPDVTESGMRQLNLYVLDGAGTGLKAGDVLVVKRKSTIGRASDADIVLDDASVSQQHARLEKSKGSWRIRDLKSTNGTMIESSYVMDPTALNCGDSLTLGRVRLRLVC